MIYKIKSQEPGFNLLETIIASMIFLSTIVVITSVWVWYGRTVAVSRNVLVGSQLGESVIEQCVGTGFHQIDSMHNKLRVFVMTTTIDGKEIKNVYRCKVMVSPLGITTGVNLKTVVVEVSWDNKTGPEAIKFETELFRQE